MIPVDRVGPAELGRRLQRLATSTPPLAGVVLARDVESGATWWLRSGHGAGQAQLEVAAGMLYRAGDFAASTWRLVETEAGLAVAQEARLAWSTGVTDDDLEPGLALDLWLGNVGGPRAARRRLLPVPGPRVLRLDLAHALGWDGLGLARSGADWPRLPRPTVPLDRSPLAGVTIAEIDEALDGAALEGDRRSRLRSILLDRLSVLTRG